MREELEMRDRIIHWIGKARNGAIRVGRCIRRHTVLAACGPAADGARFAEEDSGAASKSVLRSPRGRTGND